MDGRPVGAELGVNRIGERVDRPVRRPWWPFVGSRRIWRIPWSRWWCGHP